jgi:hypothetical protein
VATIPKASANERASSAALALQLHFSFDVRAPGFGLMSTPPE